MAICFMFPSFSQGWHYITTPTSAFCFKNAASSRGSALNPLHSGNVSHNTAGTHATSWLQTSQRLIRGSPSGHPFQFGPRLSAFKEDLFYFDAPNLLNSPWEVSELWEFPTWDHPMIIPSCLLFLVKPAKSPVLRNLLYPPFPSRLHPLHSRETCLKGDRSLPV